MPPKARAGAKGPATRPAPQRLASKVQAMGASGQVSKNFCVWSDLAPSVVEKPELCFAKCTVLPGSTATKYKLRQVDPPGKESVEFEAPPERLLNCNEETMNPLVLRDIGLLSHQNTAAVLDFLKSRFMKNVIYTTADPLLVAVNPFRDIGNCTNEWIVKYRDAQSVQNMPPHTFSVAREAMENLFLVNKSQTIIVTGESGAGKTEATKHCMKYFACAKGKMDLRIQTAVMAANPVLEAFGNAKTLRNNNSSRFGRFMQLVLAPQGGILNGKVIGFLLEKVRIVSQAPNERSYHIFYQFLKGATAQERQKFKLMDMKSYKNLTAVSGGCFDAPGIDDLKEWGEVRESFVSMQLSQEQIDTILSIVSGVLMMGNVEFEGKTIDGQDNAAQVKNMEVLQTACQLMKLDHDVNKVAQCLCTTVKTIAGDSVTVRIQRPEAESLCQSLAKAMYDNLFKWIIKQLNSTIAPADGNFGTFMGMLDIFGFEIFENNSLEQILINITNEFLQKNFIDIVFQKESKLYRDEGVSTTELVFTSNEDVIECLIGKRMSVFSLLEDACVNKGGSDQSFYSTMCSNLGKAGAKQIFKKPATGDRDLIFTIAHTIADINYSAQGFLKKNMDLLKPELAEVAQTSSSPVVQQMFEGIVIERGKLAKGQLIASQFLVQLDTMMNTILQTEPHFIRCVKPNETKKPLDWDNQKVLNQLFSLSILEALQLKKLGFSWRRPFREFVTTFRYLSLDCDAKMKSVSEGDVEKERAIAIEMLGICGKVIQPFQEGKQWQLGKTMVFLKPETSHEMILAQRRTLETYAPTITLIDCVLKAKLRRRTVKSSMPYSVRIQSLVRKQLIQHGNKSYYFGLKFLGFVT